MSKQIDIDQLVEEVRRSNQQCAERQQAEAVASSALTDGFDSWVAKYGRRSLVGQRMVAAAVALLLVGGGLWIGLQPRDSLTLDYAQQRVHIKCNHAASAEQMIQATSRIYNMI